jgi:hypothetical protein
MNLQPITELDPQTHEEHAEMWDAIKTTYGDENGNVDADELFGLYLCEKFSTTEVHTGIIPDGMELTELELAMICDNGFTNGGKSHIYPDNGFRVEIYTEG